MLRTLILAAGLLAASGSALAHDDYGYRHGRVISVEPNFVISFGTRHHDGFRILYESGGHRYWTHSQYRPGPLIVLPARHIHHQYHYRSDWHDRHDWRDDRRDWRHDRRDDRRDDRHEHRRHGRD